MARKTEERKAALKEKLTDIAEAQIAREGAASLRARDLARKAECSVGQIYNVFPDMTALAMAVNGRTFRRIGERVAGSVDKGQPPIEQLIALAGAYLAFATQERNLWRALFDLEATQTEVPQWYLAALEQLFAHIAVPVAALFPELDKVETARMTRALFSSVHGIVLLGLERRISAVPEPEIARTIEIMLRRLGNE